MRMDGRVAWRSSACKCAARVAATTRIRMPRRMPKRKQEKATRHGASRVTRFKKCAARERMPERAKRGGSIDAEKQKKAFNEKNTFAESTRSAARCFA